MNIKINKPQCFSEVGQKANQEDALFPPIGSATAKGRIFMVCDGMGGHEHGEVASNCVAATVGKLLDNAPVCTSAEMRQRFESALAKAYEALDRLDTDPQALRKMGTTLTFLAFCTDGVVVAHIGDSRVYQLRQGEGIVFQTHDHSLVNDLIAAGELDEESARTFPQKNVITRAVQPHQEHPAKATIKVLTDVRPADVFFLCCDGIVEQLDNDDLVRILLSDQSLDSRLELLKKECADRHTRDNNSCYAIEVAAVEGAPAVITNKSDSQSVTKTRPTPPKPHSHLRQWILIVLGALLLCSCLVFLANKKSGQSTQQTPTEHSSGTQGTIERNR